MELRHYFAILWRRKWVVILAVVITTVVTAIGSYLVAPQYVATATLWIPASNGQQLGSGDILYADRLINTYVQLSTSGPILKDVSKRLGIPAAQFKDTITPEPVAQTELLRINVQDTDPQMAAVVATEVAESILRQTQKTAVGRERRVSLFAEAGVPVDPTWMGIIPTPFWREINIGLGFLVGLLGGVALAFLFEYLDTTLYTTKEIETATELATLGEIPIADKRQAVTMLNGNSLHAEAFRYLRTSIFIDQSKPLQSLLVTSAIPGEGKSTVVANLALALAQSGRNVIVVDADLRQPTLHKIFNLTNNVGLSNLLKQEATLEEALQESHVPGVKVITSGNPPHNPAELLDSPQVVTLIEQLKQYQALILIDTPSLMAVTDAAVLAPLVDGVVMVVGRAQVHQEAVQAARYQLAAVNAKLVGLVVNRVVQDLDYYHRYTSKVN